MSTANRKTTLSRTILKAMGLFGGTQVASILCSIVRTKLVAIWIGPAGMGLFALFNNAIEMIASFSSLGIRNSSVRDMAIASESGDTDRFNRTILAIRRWSWLISVFGAVITLALAPTLSRTTFGDTSRTWDFMLLASVLMFNGLTNGELAILQGSALLKRMAKASLWGTFSGLAISIPLFYFWRDHGIIPSIIAYALMNLLFATAFRSKGHLRPRMSAKETWDCGKDFMRLGIYMTVSMFITLLFSYAFSAFLNRTSGTAEVGYYQAGFTLVTKYVGLVFTAIGMEYYPRLAKVHRSRLRLRAYVSQEMHIALLVITPIMLIFIICRELLIHILYSPDFIVIKEFISFAIIGTGLRAVSWCMSFVILAKGDGRIYLCTELSSAATGFLLNIIFYHFWGLSGLGISYTAWYAVYCLIIGYVYIRRYKLSIGRNILLLAAASTAVAMAVACLMDNGKTIAAAVITAATAILCLYRIYRTAKR